MDLITQEIEKMAEKLTKASQGPKDKLFQIIKSLGKNGLTARLAVLTDDDKVILKAALQEMNLKKAGPSGKKGHKHVITDVKYGHMKDGQKHEASHEYPVSVEHDESGKIHSFMPPSMSDIKEKTGHEVHRIDHPTLLGRNISEFKEHKEDVKKAVSMDPEAAGAHNVQGKVKHTVIQEDKADDDIDETLVKPEAAFFDHQGTPTPGWEGQVIKAIKVNKMNKSEEFWNQVLKSDDLLTDVVSKMMDKGAESGMVMDKLAKKGMDKKKVQGAMDKYKMEKCKDEEMNMNKDSKKMSEMEKKEKVKKAIEKTFTKAMNKVIKKANHILSEENQLGDAPNLEVDGKNKSGVKKENVKALNLAEDSEDAQKKVNDLSQGRNSNMSKALDSDKAKKEKEEREHAENEMKNKKMKKSISWEDPNRLFKTNILGRNFNFNIENFVAETLGNAGKYGEIINKSENKKDDLNDIIAKSQDKTWGDLDQERQTKENASKINGKLVKSFEDTEISKILGLSEEETKRILG